MNALRVVLTGRICMSWRGIRGRAVLFQPSPAGLGGPMLCCAWKNCAASRGNSERGRLRGITKLAEADGIPRVGWPPGRIAGKAIA